MSKFVSSLVIGGAMVLAAAPAHAFPAAPSATMQPASDVIQVAGGCGPGRHRGPGGGCRPNVGPVVVVPPPVVVAPRPVVVAPAPVVVVPRKRCWWAAGPGGRVRVCG